MEQFIIQQRREGFLVAAGHFQLPTEVMGLDPKTKQTLTICNLFVNHNMALIDIARVLDEDRRNVIRALLEHEITRTQSKTERSIRQKRIEGLAPDRLRSLLARFFSSQSLWYLWRLLKETLYP